MNERIRELAKQAGDYVNETYTGPVRSKTPGKIWEDGHIGWNEQFQAKFAELIVQECAEIAFMNAPYANSQVSGGTLGDIMKQHFGVEE
jgi:hypothetical protein